MFEDTKLNKKKRIVISKEVMKKWGIKYYEKGAKFEADDSMRIFPPKNGILIK